jgi:hypothetical protein
MLFQKEYQKKNYEVPLECVEIFTSVCYAVECEKMVKSLDFFGDFLLKFVQQLVDSLTSCSDGRDVGVSASNISASPSPKSQASSASNLLPLPLLYTELILHNLLNSLYVVCQSRVTVINSLVCSELFNFLYTLVLTTLQKKIPPNLTAVYIALLSFVDQVVALIALLLIELRNKLSELLQKKSENQINDDEIKNVISTWNFLQSKFNVIESLFSCVEKYFSDDDNNDDNKGGISDGEDDNPWSQSEYDRIFKEKTVGAFYSPGSMLRNVTGLRSEIALAVSIMVWVSQQVEDGAEIKKRSVGCERLREAFRLFVINKNVSTSKASTFLALCICHLLDKTPPSEEYVNELFYIKKWIIQKVASSPVNYAPFESIFRPPGLFCLNKFHYVV